MANTLVQQGFFSGRKQSFWVTPATVTSGWYTGQLFKIVSVGAARVASPYFGGAPSERGPFVALNSTSGAAIAGVAMEGSADVTTAVAGMSQPSGSKVTLLGGPASFYIQFKGTATVSTAGGRKRVGAPWEADVEASSIMSLLYASANGNFCVSDPRSAHTVFGGTADPLPVGYLSQVPMLANSWTMGVVLF